jgi:RimJ/RimL family protein N-acetyltransferase
VAEPYAGSGVSANIIATCSDWARAAGLQSLRLDCWDGNDNLRAVYRKLGFTEGVAVPEHDWLVRLFELRVGGGAHG